MRPGIIIENNNLIYVIGNDGSSSSWNHDIGVIEYYDIRDKKWNENEIDELNKIFDSSLLPLDRNKKRYFENNIMLLWDS